LTDIVSVDKKGMWKVAPVLNLSDEDMLGYLEKNNLPNEIDYYDPTKVYERRECGLHNRK
jgi:phosphoadenosine phosphosulfate reductase